MIRNMEEKCIVINLSKRINLTLEEITMNAIQGIALLLLPLFVSGQHIEDQVNNTNDTV